MGRKQIIRVTSSLFWAPSYLLRCDQQHVSAAILLDPITMPGCCGVVTGWQLSVQGDSSSSATCQSGCEIDFIVWTDVDTSTADPNYVQAAIAGINRATGQRCFHTTSSMHCESITRHTIDVSINQLTNCLHKRIAKTSVYPNNLVDKHRQAP